jgi:hypothetical protein
MMKGQRQYTIDIQDATTNRHLPVIESSKNRILRRIRRSKHARNNKEPSVAEIVMRIAAALMMIAVSAEAVSR